MNRVRQAVWCVLGMILVGLSGCVSRPNAGPPRVREPQSAEEFNTLVRNSRVPVLVAFVSHDCPSCEHTVGTLNKLSADYGRRLLVVKADLALMGKFVTEYRLTKVPTFLVFRRGVEVKRRRGWLPATFMHGFVDEAMHLPVPPRQ